jgi:flagellar motor switch protein FliG
MTKKANSEGLKKTACLLIALGPEVSSKILRTLPEPMIRSITQEIARVEDISAGAKRDIIEEFLEQAEADEFGMEGGADYATQILNGAMGREKAREMMHQINEGDEDDRPFRIIQRARPEQIVNLLFDEHPQTISLILCYLEPQKAAEVLEGFSVDRQVAISERMVTMTNASPTVIRRIEKIMDEKFGGLVPEGGEQAGGIRPFVEILNSMDKEVERSILEIFEEKQPEIAEKIRANRFLFEDIISLDKVSVQRFLREISNEDLSLALKGASDNLKKVIFDNMSNRASEMLREDIKFMGPVRLQAVEEAQHKITEVISKLEESGEIVISRGGNDELVL